MQEIPSATRADGTNDSVVKQEGNKLSVPITNPKSMPLPTRLTLEIPPKVAALIFCKLAAPSA